MFERLTAPADFNALHFFECFARLSGGSDVADEVLERQTTLGSDEYAPWDERAGARARNQWRKTHEDPLRDVRAYRNRLVHGRVVPEWVFIEPGESPARLLYPRLDRVEYLDWRVVYGAVEPQAVLPDFDDAYEIVREAWKRTVGYANSMWLQHLL